MARPPLILDLAAEHVPATLLRQQRLAKLVGDHPVDVDLDRGVVRFGDEVTVTAQLLGSTDDEHRTFTWAWASPEGTVRDDLLTGVRAFRDYGLELGIEELTEATWHTDDVDPFLLAAIARGWTQADAMLRVPVAGGAVYLLLGDVPLPAPDPHQVSQALTTGIAMAPMDHRRATMSLFADNRMGVTGLDEIVVGSIGTAVVTVAFTSQGRIADVSVSQV